MTAVKAKQKAQASVAVQLELKEIYATINKAASAGHSVVQSMVHPYGLCCTVTAVLTNAGYRIEMKDDYTFNIHF